MNKEQAYKAVKTFHTWACALLEDDSYSYATTFNCVKYQMKKNPKKIRIIYDNGKRITKEFFKRLYLNQK